MISTQAPPDLDTDVVAFRALLPQRFELGGTAWCAGLWPDAVSLWEMLGKTKLIPAGGAAPPPRHVALALAMVDGDGDDPAAVSSALDKVTVAVVAALRPADPAVSLSRSPLDPAVLVRADGSVASCVEIKSLTRLQCERIRMFDTSSSAGLRELDESDRSVQKSAESTSI